VFFPQTNNRLHPEVLVALKLSQWEGGTKEKKNGEVGGCHLLPVPALGPQQGLKRRTTAERTGGRTSKKKEPNLKNLWGNLLQSYRKGRKHAPGEKGFGGGSKGPVYAVIRGHPDPFGQTRAG